jgi:hypothetical protein
MIDKAVLEQIRLVFIAVVFTVIGPMLMRDGLRLVDTGGTKKDKREAMETRVFMTVDTFRWLLGRPRKASLSRADMRLLGWMDVVLGAGVLVVGLWAWLDVLRWLLGVGR